jgi:hypothetical protein
MAIVLTLCVSYLLFCLFTLPPGAITTPDSAHYLNASPIVPLGYPALLALVGERGAMVVQPALFSAALAFLGRETIRATGSAWLAFAVVGAAMVVPQVKDFHASILTESLFMSAVIVFLSLAMRFVQQPSWHFMVWVATAAGLSATVRRTGFALVPVMVALVLLQRHRLSASRTPFFLVAAAAPFVVIIGMEQFAAGVVHAGQTSSLMGRHLFAKAALIEAPPAAAGADPLHAQLDEQLERDYAPIRGLLRRAPDDVRAVLAIQYETCLQGPCVDRSRALMPDWTEPAQTETLGEAGWARIARAPLSFAGLVATHYGSLWTVNRVRHPATAPALTAFIKANRPLPFEREAFRADPGDDIVFRGSESARYLQLAVLAVGMITGALALVGLLAAVSNLRLPPAFVIASVAALTAHGGVLLTALLAAGFSRFLLGLWPAITTATLVGLWGILNANPTNTENTENSKNTKNTKNTKNY